MCNYLGERQIRSPEHLHEGLVVSAAASNPSMLAKKEHCKGSTSKEMIFKRILNYDDFSLVRKNLIT
jgi:hypothetical protein